MSLTTRPLRGLALCAGLVSLVLLASASSPAAAPGRPADHGPSTLPSRIGELARSGVTVDLLDEATNAAILRALASLGIPEEGRQETVRQLLPELRALAAPPTLQVGPLVLTRAQVRAVAGPREGRRRDDVVARLAALPGASALDQDELEDLVPVVARLHDDDPTRTGLDLLVVAIAGRPVAE